MKVAQSIANRIRKETDTVFGVTGGCIINVVDAMHKAGIRIVPMHHEQSAAIAADAYARFKGFGCCFGTSGPGITNLITGVACSYFDSVPVLALGGQVLSKYLDGRDRQTGFQEVDGVALMRPVTKDARRYTSPISLDMAISIAMSPRKGPAFIEIPDDIQRAGTEIHAMPHYDAAVDTFAMPDFTRFKKPIAILGAGVRDTPKWARNIQCPFLYTWATKDLFQDHAYCKGDFGITGSPYGNLLLREADCIIMIGTRMDTHQVPDWSKFAPQAHKIAIGLEFPHNADRRICADLRIGFNISGPDWCAREPQNSTDTPIYRWIDQLSEMALPDDIIIPDMGQTGCIAFQRWKVKQGQRLFNGMNHSPMGYSLPGAIGATLATGRRVIVIIGEGSLMMNLQDLSTISEMNLPINIFVVKNGGYGMIRQTQDDWKQYLDQGVGCNFDLPHAKAIGDAFGIQYSTVPTDKSPSIMQIHFEDTKIQPKWKYGEEL